MSAAATTLNVPLETLKNIEALVISIKKERDDESKAIRIAGIVFLVLAVILFTIICICGAGIGLFAAGALIVSLAVIAIVGIGMFIGGAVRDLKAIWLTECHKRIYNIKALLPQNTAS